MPNDVMSTARAMALAGVSELVPSQPVRRRARLVAGFLSRLSSQPLASVAVSYTAFWFAWPAPEPHPPCQALLDLYGVLSFVLLPTGIVFNSRTYQKASLSLSSPRLR